VLSSFPIWLGNSQLSIFEILQNFFFRNLQIFVDLRHTPEVKTTFTWRTGTNPSEDSFSRSDFLLQQKSLLRLLFGGERFFCYLSFFLYMNQFSRFVSCLCIQKKSKRLSGGGGGATRPLPRDGGVEELHGDPTFGFSQEN